MNKVIAFLFLTFQVFGQSELKVMSYNIRLGSVDDKENNWEFRKEKVSDLLLYYEADFIGLQEAQKFQLDYIQMKLANYNRIGLPREKGQFAEYSCILYNKNKYDLIEEKTFWLSTTPDSISRGWDAACNRIVTYGLFKNRKDKKLFWIGNTHFDHIGKQARMESAKLLSDLELILKSKKNVPIIITGDFNATPDDEIIKYLKSNYFDAFSTSCQKPYGNSGTWNGFDFNKIPENRIDYIFYDKTSKIKVQKFITIDDFYNFKYPSDHLPIMANFSY